MLRKTTVSLFALLLGALPLNAALADDDAPDFANDTLTGDWGGTRTNLYNHGVLLEASYKLDGWDNFSGGLKRASSVLDDFDLKLTVDGEKAFGWQGATFFIYALNNFGGHPNALVGSNGGIDNIETSINAVRLYEAWVQQNFWDDRLSILVGLHDLNSEFYVTETSGLFLNPTYGIGTEMAATGDNGPSVFPITALAARVEVKPTDNTYAKLAVFDGVPGDPTSPRTTQIELHHKDGALVVAEGGLMDDTLGQLAVGAWIYTAKRPDQLTALPRRSRGVYLLGDHSFYSDEEGRDVSAFARVGFTAGDIEQFSSNWSLGTVLTGFVPTRPEGQIGLAVTQNINSDKYKTVNAPVNDSETQFELTYADQLTPWLSIQPDLQYTINPGTTPTVKDAWTAGVRVAVEF